MEEQYYPVVFLVELQLASLASITRRLSGSLAVVSLVFALSTQVSSAGTFVVNHHFEGWKIGYKDPMRIESEVSRSFLPLNRMMFATCSSLGLALQYDGKMGGLNYPVVSDLEFDLPVGAFDRSTTITFGSALFQMDLPFLSFDKASATYSFKSAWKAPSSPSLSDDSVIQITSEGYDVSDGQPFDPSSLIRENHYNLDGSKLTLDRWGASTAPQMLSAVVMGYDLDEIEESDDESITAMLGAVSPASLDASDGNRELGFVGILATLALAGAALFITMEINRDKFDKYR